MVMKVGGDDGDEDDGVDGDNCNCLEAGLHYPQAQVKTLM